MDQQVGQQFQQIHGLLYGYYQLLIRQRRKIASLEARECLRTAGRTPRFSVEFTSQYGEDALIWDIFDGKLDGFFIEVGAFDGYNYAVTYGLEAIGWNGLLVEPIPQRYEQCKARRPHSRVVHGALSHPGHPPTLELSIVNDVFGGMLSFVAGAHEQQARMTQHGAQMTKVRVPVYTLNELLKDHTGPIDVASIDVESYEIPVLQGFDLNRFKPRVLLIEDEAGAPRQDLTNYLSTIPYTWCGMLECNRVLVRNDEPVLLERAQRILTI